MGYTERMRENREKINAALLPIGASVTYVGTVFGMLNVIWYFGKHDTGFAGGSTPEAVVESICDKVCGGL